MTNNESTVVNDYTDRDKTIISLSAVIAEQKEKIEELEKKADFEEKYKSLRTGYLLQLDYIDKLEKMIKELEAENERLSKKRRWINEKKNP